MTANTDTHVMLRAFVDELARCGMRAACTSPGSRNAPLVLALARDEHLTCDAHVDERAAGFFALGWTKRMGVPVAVTCTSGTAAAELLPAAVEAREARVPLLLLTADRPAELRENGAGQAVDQLKMFGSAVKWFVEVELPPQADAAALRWIRTLACRAYATSLEGRPGAVHLNFPLREPLVPDGELPADASGRPERAPYVTRLTSPSAGGWAERALEELAGKARRPVIVAGRSERGGIQAYAQELGAKGWPVLADPMSRARRGPAAVAHYDALLRDAEWAEAMRPDLVLRVGDLPVSKPLRTWLAGLDGVPQVALDPEAAWQDPASVLSVSLDLEPERVVNSLPAVADPGWLAGWRGADDRAEDALEDVLGGEQLSEPRVAAELSCLKDGEEILFVASSMPIRDVESVWPVLDVPAPVLCNRGANGIDGTVSSAFGAAAAASYADLGEQVVLLIGDVALAHDIGGLLASARLGLKLTIVLIENGGGGIFDFLPVSGSPYAREVLAGDGDGDGEDLYTRHVATPTGLDFARAAALYGLEHERVTTGPGFREALERALRRPGSGIIEVPSDRERNVAVHRRMWESVAATVSR
jgi:2-succinyl-5-enolpyruvyl-6-hydroxy-3-cyclohexene-1-carboxylate synthase